MRCLRLDILHLLLKELSFDTPGVEIGPFLKKNSEPDLVLHLVHTYDASDAIDAKHGFESKSLQVMLEIGQNSNFQPKPNLLTLLKCQKVCRLCSKVCAGPFQNLNLLT